MVLKNRMHQDSGGLSVSCTISLRGLMASTVLLHHVYQNISVFHGSVAGGILQLAGYLAVSVFFFLSGYGLTTQYLRSPAFYRTNFLCRRVLPYYCEYLFIVFVYIAFFMAMGEPGGFLTIFQSLLYGKTIVAKGWYFQTQLLIYAFFYVAIRFCPKKIHIWLLFELVVFCVCNYMLGMESTWYESVFAFWEGTIWAA